MIESHAALRSQIACDSDLEGFIEAFEEAVTLHGAKLGPEYLPNEEHANRLEIITELIRTELDLSHTAKNPREIQEYRFFAEEVFRSPEHLAAILYEDFRLREAAGEEIEPSEYLDTYNLPKEYWPSTVADQNKAATFSDFPKPGETFDGMPLDREIGRGAFSRVFLARQPEFGNRLVALKITPHRSIEPQNLGRLQHTNIVPIYSTHHERNLLGICMPFFGAITLADWLLDRSRSLNSPSVSTLACAMDSTTANTTEEASSVPSQRTQTSVQHWRLAADCVAQLAEGLAHAHERGVVHSDVKPANILLGDDGLPRLLDFNLSGSEDVDPHKSLVVGGTVPYMAPEHLEAVTYGSKVIPQSDIFSLGVLLYQMLTGNTPYQDRPFNTQADADRLIEDRLSAPSLRSLAPDVPAGLEAIVLKCLKSDTRERYQSATALMSDLRNELSDQELEYATEPIGPARCAKWLRRNFKSLVRVAAFASVCVVAFLFVRLHMQTKKTERLTAQKQYQEFLELSDLAKTALCVPDAPHDLLLEGHAHAREAIQLFDDNFVSLSSQEEHGPLSRDQRYQIASTVSLLTMLSDRASLELQGKNNVHEREWFQEDPVLLSANDKISSGEYAAAIALLEKEIATSQRNPALRVQLGVAEAASGDWQSSLESLTAAITLQDQSPIAWFNRGIANIQAGHPDRALDDFDNALLRAPQSISIHLNRGIALSKLYRWKEAEDAFTKAIDLGSQHPRSFLLRARTRMKLGKHQGAELDQAHAMSLKPIDAEDWSSLAIACKTSEAKYSLDLINEGLANFPNSITLLRNKIHLLGDVLNRPNDALVPAESILRLRPGDIRATLSRAIIYARSGRSDQAIEEVQNLNIYKLTPTNCLQLAGVYALSSEERPDRFNRSLLLVQSALVRQPGLSRLASRDSDLLALRDNDSFIKLIESGHTLSKKATTSTTASSAFK